MAIIEGAGGFKAWTGDYSFAIDGGATSTIVLRSNDGGIPAGAIIWGGGLDVTSSLLSGTGTVALQVEGAGDILATVGQAGVTAGRKSIIPVSFATAVKTTVVRAPSLVIATAAFTAGVMRIHLFYR